MESELNIVDVKEYLLSEYKKRKVLPPVKVIAERFGVPESKILEVFRTLIREGFLRKNYAKYRVVDTTSTPANDNVAEVIEKKKRSIWIMILLRILLAIVGVGAISVSVYYTNVWFLEYLPPFLAFVLACIMVIFSTVAFEVVLLLFRARRWLFGTGFLLLFLIVLCFSMASTVAGQYNKRMKAEQVHILSTAGVLQAQMKYDILRKQEEQVKAQIRTQEDTRRVYQRLLEAYDLDRRTEDPLGFDRLRTQLEQVDRKIVDLQQQLMQRQQAIVQYLSQEEGSIALVQTQKGAVSSFFIWIAHVFNDNISPDLLQFFFAVFPAVFVDIIAPFSVAFVLFQSHFSYKRRSFNTWKSIVKNI